MSADPHPEARTLAEALNEWLSVRLGWGSADVLTDDLMDWMHCNSEGLAALASHPPAEPGWVDITEEEVDAEVRQARAAGVPMHHRPSAQWLHACNIIARRRFAERASGEEGDRG